MRQIRTHANKKQLRLVFTDDGPFPLGRLRHFPRYKSRLCVVVFFCFFFPPKKSNFISFQILMNTNMVTALKIK